MTTSGHPLALAAGTVPDLAPAAAVRRAGDAGFALAGIRTTAAAVRSGEVIRPVAAALAATGVGLLDAEYLRLIPGPLTVDQRRLADAAGELGARHLLVVSDDPDDGATCAKLAELGELLAGSPTRLALEFMLFTAVRMAADAARIVRAVPGVGVVLDVLHLHRSAGARSGAPRPDSSTPTTRGAPSPGSHATRSRPAHRGSRHSTRRRWPTPSSATSPRSSRPAISPGSPTRPAGTGSHPATVCWRWTGSFPRCRRDVRSASRCSRPGWPSSWTRPRVPRCPSRRARTVLARASPVPVPTSGDGPVSGTARP